MQSFVTGDHNEEDKKKVLKIKQVPWLEETQTAFLKTKTIDIMM